MTTPLLQADGLVLRALEPARDAVALFPAFGDAALMRYWPYPAYRDVDQLAKSFGDWTTRPGDANWAITTDGSAALGHLTLYHFQAGVLEASIVLTPAAHGRGLARRALALALPHGFAAMRANRIQAEIHPANAASVRAFEAAGFVFEGRLRATYTSHRGVRDSLMYAAIAPNLRWEEEREGETA